jgi:hypothetical protein
MTSPQGNPHQPTIAESNRSPAWARTPQRRQHSLGVLFHVEKNRTDATQCDVWMSTGRLPWQPGHGPDFRLLFTVPGASRRVNE